MFFNRASETGEFIYDSLDADAKGTARAPLFRIIGRGAGDSVGEGVEGLVRRGGGGGSGGCVVVGGRVAFFDGYFGGGERSAETEEGTCGDGRGHASRGGHRGGGGGESIGRGRDGRGRWGMRCSDRLYSSRWRGGDIGSGMWWCVDVEILDAISQLS